MPTVAARSSSFNAFELRVWMQLYPPGTHINECTDFILGLLQSGDLESFAVARFSRLDFWNCSSELESSAVALQVLASEFIHYTTPVLTSFGSVLYHFDSLGFCRDFCCCTLLSLGHTHTHTHTHRWRWPSVWALMVRSSPHRKDVIEAWRLQNDPKFHQKAENRPLLGHSIVASVELVA